MRSIGLDPEKDVFIASVLKCRPPKNRLPKREEVAACAPHLAKQFSLVAPAVVVPLGATAFSRLIPDGDFAESVGKFLNVTLAGRSVPAFPIYHPAYLLYSPKKKSTMRVHVATLKQFLADKGLLDASRTCPDF
jgi:DNA polymerase